MIAKKALTAWFAVLSLGIASYSYAGGGVTITTSNGTGTLGSMPTPAMISFDYHALDSDDVAGIQFQFNYDPNLLSVNDLSNCPSGAPPTHSGSSFCSDALLMGGPMRRVLVLIFDINPPTDEIMPTDITPLGSIAFNCLQPGVHTLTFANFAAADVNAQNVPMSGNDVTITCNIVGAAGYDSTPPPGSTLNFGGVVVGATSMAQNITVSEIGDQQLDVTAIAFTGGTDFASATAPFSIPDGGMPVDVDVTCAPTARGALTDTLELTNNSVNTPNPQYTLNCSGLSPNVQVMPTTVNLNGVIGGTPPTGTFNVTNPQDGFASDAGNATLTEGTPGGTITITDGLTDATITVGETDGVTVSCDTAAPGMFTDTVTVSWNDPAAMGGIASAVVQVDCNILNAQPSFDSTPAAPGPLAFGNVTNGTTSAPIGINVGNDGFGPSPQSDLTIASVVSSNPAVFAATLVNPGPFLVGPPSGGADITVTCSPPPGSSAQITGTLTVNHNGDDNPTVFNMTCDPVTDAAFGSTPPAGTVAVGTVFPGNTGTTTIVLENNGASDNLSNINCSITGDPELAIDSPTFPVATLAPGGTIDMVVSCTVQTPGLFSADIACTADDPTGAAAPQTLNFTVTCTGQPLVVPTLSYWGLIALALLLAFGGLAAYRFRISA